MQSSVSPKSARPADTGCLFRDVVSYLVSPRHHQASRKSEALASVGHLNAFTHAQSRFHVDKGETRFPKCPLCRRPILTLGLFLIHRCHVVALIAPDSCLIPVGQQSSKVGGISVWVRGKCRGRLKQILHEGHSSGIPNVHLSDSLNRVFFLLLLLFISHCENKSRCRTIEA